MTDTNPRIIFYILKDRKGKYFTQKMAITDETKDKVISAIENASIFVK